MPLFLIMWFCPMKAAENRKLVTLLYGAGWRGPEPKPYIITLQKRSKYGLVSD
jgi:hypothetical protein